MRRVVITGTGVISSTGIGTENLWNNIKNGKHGFSRIERFDSSEFAIKYAAEIKDFDPTAFGISKKEIRRNDLFSLYASAAANEAIENAGDLSGYNPYKIGVIVGSGIGGFSSIESEHAKYLEKGDSRISVFFIPMMITNMAGGKIAIDHGFKGENFCPVSACSSSAHAVGEAFRKIKYGYLDACITGGAEAAITQFSLGGFNVMGALSRSEDPDRLSIPFDKERNGFVMGEGGAVLVLEELESAIKRGARIIAEVVGYGATDDAYHITSPHPDGEGAAKAMQFAVEEAGITVSEVDYINAHGTSTELNDNYETKAIKAVFGEEAYKIPVSSTKSMTGHLLGAAGAMEAIICANALKESVIPPTAGYKIPDPECDLDYVAEGLRESNIKYAISNSLGFGGHNASLAFKKFER